MTAQVQVNITRHRKVADHSYGASSTRTRVEAEVLSATTAQMEDSVCAAMLRQIADVLDPYVPPSTPKYGPSGDVLGALR